jgi:hypothetical protein
MFDLCAPVRTGDFPKPFDKLLLLGEELLEGRHRNDSMTRCMAGRFLIRQADESQRGDDRRD